MIEDNKTEISWKVGDLRLNDKMLQKNLIKKKIGVYQPIKIYEEKKRPVTIWN